MVLRHPECVAILTAIVGGLCPTEQVESGAEPRGGGDQREDEGGQRSRPMIRRRRAGRRFEDVRSKRGVEGVGMVSRSMIRPGREKSGNKKRCPPLPS